MSGFVRISQVITSYFRLG